MTTWMTSRRGEVVALAVMTSGAVALLLAASQWQRPDSAQLLLPQDTSESSFAADAARACGWLALTGVAGVLATRKWLRSVVGAVLLVAGALTLYVVAADSQSEAPLAWRWVAIAGSVAVIVSGLLVVTAGHRWPSLSRRYDGDSEGKRDLTTSTSEPLQMWRALDRGDDPT
jgi:hypothetical protein